ncbi:MAG: 4-hydroxy-tetrahydrodipicolinate reductase [Acidimicrobiales bacterium]|nr:MAG: 4-hydroxy-tetrahydrodipicolinate reductase [Acidimicrobiales bacterium]
MMRVGVLGAGGRMGTTICRAVAGDPDLDLVAAVDPRLAGTELSQLTGAEAVRLGVDGDIDGLSRAQAEVAVDFTEATAAMENLRWCAAHGVHAVVGTTGLSADDMAELSQLFEPSDRRPNCIAAANFAVGAVLMMRLAEMAAPYMDSAEIVELHHDAKRDAPSGTALHTAERMAGARWTAGAGDWAPDPTRTEVLPGARGGLGPAGVRLHSVRLRGLVAHHEVLMGAAGQSLTIRHDSYDRSSFMPGVLLAVKSVASRPGVTLGLEPLLGF